MPGGSCQAGPPGLKLICLEICREAPGGAERQVIMHELSLMDGVVRQLKSSASQNNISKIIKVVLVVGKLTMAQPDALQFAFEVFKKEEPLLEGGVLEIREEPVRGECQDCRSRFEIANYEFICPECNSPRVKIAGGRELYIDYYEGD